MPVQAQTAPEPSIPYTVVTGDKLIALSLRLLKQPSDWAEVARFNKLGDANALKLGQVIAVPVRLMKSQPAAGKLISVSGDVTLASNSAAVGNPVNEGARLQTGANSSAVLELADGSRVTLLPNTLAELSTSRGYSTRAKAKSTGPDVWFSGLIRLVQGSLDTAANKLARRATPLQIETPTSLVGVRGTQFRVAYDGPATQNARTEVLEGLVRADNPAQASGAAIARGEGAVLNPAIKEIAVVALLAAPDLSATPALVYKPAARWPMPGYAAASSFRVQVASDAGFNQIVRDAVVVSNGFADFSTLADGNWFARVRAIDGAGLEGFDSMKTIQVSLAPPRSWRITSDRLDVADSRHVLRLTQEGLLQGDVITATLSRAETSAAATPLALGTVRAGTDEARLDLGRLVPGAAYELQLTVQQSEGVAGRTLTYRLTGQSGSGWVRDTLQLMP
jgi:hypothetical protein